MTRLTLTRPDDWHLHLRDGDIMASVLPDTARRFTRAIVMPNLKPPVTTTAQAPRAQPGGWQSERLRHPFARFHTQFPRPPRLG